MTDEVSSPWLSFQHLDPFSQKGSGNVWNNPDSKVQATNVGPIWGRQDPGGPHEPCYQGIQPRPLITPQDMFF